MLETKILQNHIYTTLCIYNDVVIPLYPGLSNEIIEDGLGMKVVWYLPITLWVKNLF